MHPSQILPLGWPHTSPIYNIDRTYLENAEQGPFFNGSIPVRSFPSQENWKDFLGFKVASLIGVPAGPLLNSRWVSFAAQMGFDIVTYKTIRSKVHPAHPAPNMIYVNTKGYLTKERFEEPLKQTKLPPQSMQDLALTNSFGIPSRDPDYLLKDIEKANQALQPGQIMIVSIVGTPRPGEDFIADFALTAQIAKDAGAKVIEADFSCPNVVSCEGSIHTNPDTIYEISKMMREAIGHSIPLIIKVGVMPNEETLRKVMLAAARADVQAICGINTVSMKVYNEEGQAALGKNRLQSGVCGGPIRLAALDFIRSARQINDQEKMGMTILGTGGVTLPEHFDQFFEAGADVAMSAVGMMWDPYLAMRYHYSNI